MQTVTQATEIIIYVADMERSRATQTARALLNAGLLPKSSGRDLKKIDAEQMLSLLAAVAMTDKIVDAPAVARAFADLPVRGLSDDADAAVETLPHFFALAMDKGRGWTNTSLEFARTGAGFTATINTTIRTETLETEISLPFWQERSWGGWAKTSFTISPEGVEIMRNLFARDDGQELTFRRSREGAAAE